MKKYFIIVFFTILLGAFACEEFLEEEPKTLVSETNFFETNATEAGVEQFINGIYPGNWWTINDRRWSWFATVPADEFNQSLSGPGFDGEGVEYDHHAFNETQFNIYRQWNYIWWPTARANTFLSHYPNLEANFGDRWTKLENFKGQALFFRAYNFFTGVQMWGPIPLVTTKPDGKNYPNSTVPEVYDQIIADLTEIIDNDYLPEWTQLAPADKGRITMGAAKSLLAKVYLTKSYYPEAAEAGDVAQAVAYAKDVVENSGYDLITQPVMNGTDTVYTAYEAAFLPINKNGKEGIWEFQFNPGQATNNNNVEWAVNGWFGAWGNARFEATPLLYNSFEPGDRRKKSFITGSAVLSPRTGNIVNTNGKIYMTKFQDNDLTTPHNHDNNWPFIRFADVLLIYAEALNKQNNGSTPEALNAINRVRNRAGLANLTGPYTYDQFLQIIQDERFKELAGEGHRLVDLRRWGYNTLKQRVEMSQPNATVEPHEVLWPFPAAELRVNPLIEQNDGY
jgi:starch-binding outer membrane protein, SusD/RagB family